MPTPSAGDQSFWFLCPIAAMTSPRWRGDGLSGLVHVSQISDKRIKSPDVVLKVGDTVKVKVIAIKDGKLSLSMKALKDVAAEEVREEKVVLPKSEELTTNLGELFKNIKLD